MTQIRHAQLQSVSCEHCFNHKIPTKRFDPTPFLARKMGGIPVFRKNDYPDASPEARRATVALGPPIDTLGRKPFQTTKVIRLGMEAVLAAAHEDYHARRGESVPIWKDTADTLAF